VSCLLCQIDSSGEVSRIVIVVGVLLVLVLIGAVGTLKLRRRLLGAEDASGVPLTLHDLRRLHAEGMMSDEEYEKAKIALIGISPPRRTAESGKGGFPIKPKPGAAPDKDRP